jgi:hypothetical protein
MHTVVKMKSTHYLPSIPEKPQVDNEDQQPWNISFSLQLVVTKNHFLVLLYTLALSLWMHHLKAILVGHTSQQPTRVQIYSVHPKVFRQQFHFAK